MRHAVKPSTKFITMEFEKLRDLITNYASESGYFLEHDSDSICFIVEDNSIGVNETIFVDILTQSDCETNLKDTIVFSGIGFPFNPLLESEKLKAISLLRGNATMRTNGYWGIEYASGTYWGNYFVSIYEEGLNNDTFKAMICTILSAKRSLEKLIEKPFHIN